VSSAFGLDAVEQPYGAAGRARSDLEFGVQALEVIPLGVGGAFGEPSGVTDAFGQVFRQVADVAPGFLSSA
jgi:hypothetical protein